MRQSSTAGKSASQSLRRQEPMAEAGVKLSRSVSLAGISVRSMSRFWSSPSAPNCAA